MSLHIPGVMVSSTYYDLREIRQQLASFLENELGYRALVSEAGAFPIDPDADTIENCRRRVELNADILLLVIGERYGSVDAGSGKSVTNIEYLAARAKGIPVYVFIENKVLAVYDVWRGMSPDQRDAAGDSIGDGRLFAFVESIRVADSVWTNGFSAASDIVRTLRTQLAYLFQDGLELRRVVSRSTDQQLLRSFGPQAFRLATERPDSWEHRLFGRLLDDAVREFDSERREFDLKFTYGSYIAIEATDFPSWLVARNGELQRLVNQANLLVNETLPEALGPPGVPGNIQQIAFVARQFARIYGETLAWSSQLRRVHTHDAWKECIDLLSEWAGLLISPIGSFGREVADGIEQTLIAMHADPPGAPRRNVQFELVFAAPDVDRFIAAMQRGVDVVLSRQP